MMENIRVKKTAPWRRGSSKAKAARVCGPLITFKAPKISIPNTEMSIIWVHQFLVNDLTHRAVIINPNAVLFCPLSPHLHRNVRHQAALAQVPHFRQLHRL